MISRILNKLFGKKTVSLNEEAVNAGVKLGINNLIESRFWMPSEPYLISVGNDCQITHGVMVFTHGGVKSQG